MAAVVGAFAHDELIIVALGFPGISHLLVSFGPDAELVGQVVRAFLREDADVLLRRVHDHLGVEIAALFGAFADDAADIGEAADGREDLAESIRAMPRGVEGADTARRCTGDGATGRILRELDAFRFRERNHLFEQEFHVEIGDAVVFERTVGFSERLALLVLAVRILRIGREAGGDEEGDGHRHLLLSDQVVEDHRHPPSAGSIGVTRAILEDHQGGFLGRVIFGWDVEGPLASVAREGLRISQLVFGDDTLGHAGLLLGVRAKDVLGVVVGLLGFSSEKAEGQQAGQDAEQLHRGAPI